MPHIVLENDILGCLTIFGYYDGAEDYYKHTVQGGIDFRNKTMPVATENGSHSTFLFIEAIDSVIADSDSEKGPLFMVLIKLYTSLWKLLRVTLMILDVVPYLMTIDVYFVECYKQLMKE